MKRAPASVYPMRGKNGTRGRSRGVFSCSSAHRIRRVHLSARLSCFVLFGCFRFPGLCFFVEGGVGSAALTAKLDSSIRHTDWLSPHTTPTSPSSERAAQCGDAFKAGVSLSVSVRRLFCFQGAGWGRRFFPLPLKAKSEAFCTMF